MGPNDYSVTMGPVRKIAEELCKELTGKQFSDLGPGEELKNLFRDANIVKYLRAGIDPKWMGKNARMDRLRKIAAR